MPFFHKIKTLPFPTQDLFNLVLDVESYPEFLPWCLASRIISKDKDEIIAELVIEFKGFTQKYESRIITKITDQLYTIEVEAISGPFKYLRNEWKFFKLTEGTKVDFFIDFKFKNVFLEYLIGLFFSQAVEKMIDAFEKRAMMMSS